MKRFQIQRLEEYQNYLRQDLTLLQKNCEELTSLNFNFNKLSEEFLEQEQDFEGNSNNFSNTLEKGKDEISLESMKLNDQDIEDFLQTLGKNTIYQGELILSNQNLTNESVIRICSILKQNKPQISYLDLSGNEKINYIGGQNLGDAIRENHTLRGLNLGGIKFGTKGSNKLIEAIKWNHHIREYNLGKLTNQGLKYFIEFLGQQHHIKNLTIAEDGSEKWSEDTKRDFLYCMRDCIYNKQILSIDIECGNDDEYERHNNFICELAILCQNNRDDYILKKNNDYKSKELNTQHPEYFDQDNHPENAFKFSVKTYIQNVIETLLDEGLYFLERERENMLRDEKIFEIKQQPINKTILEDLLTADGSILVLCKFMIRKIQEKPELGGEF